MNQLIQEIKSLFTNPRLLIQYVILNFCLISVGIAAVIYSSKEIVVDHQQVQSEKILELSDKLEKVDLPPAVEKDVKQLQNSAETVLTESDSSTDPKEKGSSTK